VTIKDVGTAPSTDDFGWNDDGNGQSPHLPPEVLAQYDLGEIRTLEPRAGGGIDESFVVTSASGQYVFKRPFWLVGEKPLLAYFVRAGWRGAVRR
jgi:hypothetical protein